jgi:DNA-binding transcriptional MerR regulator
VSVGQASQANVAARPAISCVLYSPIVPEPVVEIPNRPAFRASEVCEIAQIPAYVLKSWEKEFPGLGMASKPGGPRVYRRADVEQVMRIKHLLFAEGLTLAGARRKLEGEPKVEEEPLPELPVPDAVRDKVTRVKQELRSLLDLLSTPAAASAVPPRAVEPPAAPTAAPRPFDSGEEDARTWPPVAEPHESTAMAQEPGLPLLNGVPEDPDRPKSRRASRRAPRRAPDSQ